MNPSETLHAIIPIFGLNWWQIFLITLVIDWGIILIIKWFEPLGWKRAWWWSGVFGDIFLPIGIASGAVVARGFTDSQVWYASTWWNCCVLLVGFLSIIILEAHLWLSGRYTFKQQLMPSKLWHTLIYPFMFYFSVMTLIPLFVSHQPWWAFVAALAGYGIWLGTLIRDWVIPPDHSRAH